VSGSLAARVGAALDREIHPLVAQFARLLGEEAGACAVLFYGSNLRTGVLDGVLDFYLLMPGPPEKGMWPRVSYSEIELGGEHLRAKIATMSLARFREAAEGRTIDTTIWARFVQPSTLAWCAGDEEREEVAAALEQAACTAARLAVALGPATGTEGDYWRALFRATYRAELRVEKAGRENAILDANREHFAGLLTAALAAQGIAFGWHGGRIVPRMAAGKQARVRRWWRTRRRMGKPLNIARLLRATRTFDGAARYAAWKIHRHTGVEVALSPWQERHPILAAPGVIGAVWRARRRG
jgi:hypothetical protein